MDAKRHLILFRSLCLTGALLVAAVLRGADNDLTGEYEDAGLIFKGSEKAFPHGVSLHALLSLEFEPRLAKKLQEMAARVTVRQEPESLEIKVYDRAGEVIKQGRWKKRAGPNGRVILRFNVRDEEYFFILESATEHRLLQVTVQHNDPTALGPAASSVGTFLFPRIN